MSRLSDEQIHKVALESGIFIPHKSHMTMSELLNRNWDQGIVPLKNLSPLGKLFFYAKIKKLRRKEDCFGLFHDETNYICRSCTFKEDCSIVTHIPPRDHLKAIVDQYEDTRALAERELDRKKKKEEDPPEKGPSKVSQTLAELMVEIRKKGSLKKGGGDEIK